MFRAIDLNSLRRLDSDSNVQRRLVNSEPDNRNDDIVDDPDSLVEFPRDDESYWLRANDA